MFTELLTVVSGDHDNGVLEESSLFEGVDRHRRCSIQLAHGRVIDRLDDIHIALGVVDRSTVYISR